MGFQVKPIEITKVKCDVIVNSLGVDITHYGKICQGIMKGMPIFERDKFEKKISSWKKDVKVGQIKTTGNFGLDHTSHIIHVVTPYFKDDPELYGLEHVYKLILMTAVDKGWKKIALPIIGVGFNGYPHYYVIDMLTSLVGAFVTFYKGYQVTICTPVKTVNEYETITDSKKVKEEIEKYFKEKDEHKVYREFVYSKSDFKSFEGEGFKFKFDYSSEMIKEEMVGKTNYTERHQKFSEGSDKFLDTERAIMESGNRPIKIDYNAINPKSIYDYIRYYIDKRFISESDKAFAQKLVDERLTTKTSINAVRNKHGSAEKRTSTSTRVLMRYILTLRMTLDEANDFLRYCGKALSPIGEDVVYKELIENKICCFKDVNSYCIQKGIEKIFDFNGEEPSSEE